MLKILKKIMGRMLMRCIRTFYPIFPEKCARLQYRHLRRMGIQLGDHVGYLDPSIEYDGTDGYKLIKIGNNTTISKNVLFLTHDFSLNRGMALKGIDGKYLFKGTIVIGDNCFIGARVTLLPNTIIGDNCIVGSGAVIKGKFPENTVIVGNPAKAVCKTSDWIEKHIALEDFYRL